MSSPPLANWPPVSLTLAVNFLNCTAVIVDTGGKLTSVSTIQVAKLPSVSMTPMTECLRYLWQRQLICHRWQIMESISDHLHKKENLKEKMYLYVTWTTLRCPNKIIKLIWLKIFFHLPLVSTTLVVHSELQISPRIEMAQWGTQGLGGDWFMKKPVVENLVALFL